MTERRLTGLADRRKAGRHGHGAAPSGTRVSVTVTPGSGDHRFTVADDGPGLSDELKERALDRIWRLDASRPGTGLRLPIAQALAKTPGGSLGLGNGIAGGVNVVPGVAQAA